MTTDAPLAPYRDDGALATVVGVRVPVPPLAVAAGIVVGTGVLATATALDAPDGLVVAVGLATLALGLLRPSGSGGARTAWTVPPALRTFEYVVAVALGAQVDPSFGAGLAFAYVLAIGYHHYDVVYRLRHRGVAPDRWLTWLLGGWEVRTAVLLVAWAADAVVVVLVIASAWCGLLALGESIRFWVGGTGPSDVLPPADAEEME